MSDVDGEEIPLASLSRIQRLPCVDEDGDGVAENGQFNDGRGALRCVIMRAHSPIIPPLGV